MISAIKTPLSVLALVLFLLPFEQVSARTIGLVVSGIGGNSDYEEQFSEQGQIVATALRSISDSDTDIKLLQGRSATRESVLQTLAQLSEENADQFFLVLIGHGSVDAETWRFNIPGNDINTEDLVSALAVIDTPSQVVMIASSASGALLEILDRPGRIVVTATKSAGELNAVRFPQYLADALGSAAADVDRNEILTLAEVFRFSNEKTQQYYKEQNLLASEHARLLGSSADRVALARLGSLKLARDNPLVANLLDKRLSLEEQFHTLKAKKTTLSTKAYYEELEPLLVSIAMLQQEIDTATGWVGADE